MAVNTKQVRGRRTLRYADFDELLADAERAANEDYRALGNWTPGQIFSHLAKTFHATIDGFEFTPPWIVRFVARTFFRRRLLDGPMSPGFRLPRRVEDKFVPPPTSTREGLEQLRAAVARLKAEDRRAPNVVLGPLTREDSDRMQRSHAALHMSFLVPR